MARAKMPQFIGFTAMDNGSVDYEAHYGVIPSILHWGSHTHDFYEFYIHFGGGQKLVYDSHFYDLQPNQLYIFPPFSMHGLACLTEVRAYERGYLYCSSDTLRLLGCGQIDLDRVFRAVLEEKGNLFTMTPEDAAACKQCLIRITENRENTAFDAGFESYAMMMSFMQIVLRTVKAKTNDLPVYAASGHIQEVIAYISEHYTEPIGLKQIAASVGISQSALSHEFARYTNRGVYDYILSRRVTMAQQLILSGQPLSEIADRCGFTDYSNFLRVFQKHIGVSPREYKKTHQHLMWSYGEEKAQVAGKDIQAHPTQEKKEENT